jgi:hypothetical protein
MDATTLAVVATEQALGLPSGPMSDSEKRDRDHIHHKIKAHSVGIGACLSNIYNLKLFRGDEGDQSWEAYVQSELPQWLADAPRIETADRQRFLYEAREILSRVTSDPGCLPETVKQADALKALIPRRLSSHGGAGGNWQPAILDDPDAAEGIAQVWELACRNADQNQRCNGPTAEDVRSAREELRPALERQGLIRSAPASFQAATAARVEAARQRTVDVTPVDPSEQERKAAAFRETMAGIRATAPERTAKVEVQGVSDELSKAEREHRQMLDEEVRNYNRCLHGASKAIHELHSYLESLSRIHGTALLDEMRCIDVMGLITVSDDMQRLQEMGKELMEAVKLARSSAPSTGVNMTTLDV